MKALKKPELLAPAGNLNVALAAYSAGADAVYCGLGKFNAREMADNFTLDDMSRLAAYAKKHGKKYYLTLNTLVKESELGDVWDLIRSTAGLEPDAFIVQDIGIVRILREMVPDIPIHASTQMGIHNSAGIETAGRMGISRVILERQVTLEELEKITTVSPLEIEIFIHGALCCSLSGSCLFSSWLGGWSGNRGRCKQPCRRRFHTSERGTAKSGFYFSTQDLYTLDLIPDFKGLGIASLKIEGRLKHENYVENAVRAYRMVLDGDPGEESGLLRQARNILAGSYGRRWSHGFYTRESAKSLIQHTSLGVSGLLSGSVEKRKGNGFLVAVSRRLHIGDRIRIQPKSGDEGPSFVIRKMLLEKESVQTARKGDRVFLPSSMEIPEGSLVYKIEESGKKQGPREGNLPFFTRKNRINLSIKITRTLISISADGSSEEKWEKELDLSPAEKHPASQESIAEVFRATRSEGINAGRISVALEGEYFIPASELKALRRSFWDWFSSRPGALEKKEQEYPEFDRKSLAGEKTAGKAETVILASKKSKIKPGKGTFLCRPAGEEDGSASEVLLPHFCPEFRIPALKKLISAAYGKGIKRFRVTSIYQLELLRNYKDIEVTTSFPLPVANSLAAAELKNLQVRKVQGWIELEENALKDLAAASPLPVEIYTSGRPFILATRAEISTDGGITDSRGNKFFIERDPRIGITYVYPGELFSIPKLPGLSSYTDKTRSGPKNQEISTFNFYRTLE